jgi:hypothetical protein
MDGSVLSIAVGGGRWPAPDMMKRRAGQRQDSRLLSPQSKLLMAAAAIVGVPGNNDIGEDKFFPSNKQNSQPKIQISNPDFQNTPLLTPS